MAICVRVCVCMAKLYSFCCVKKGEPAYQTLAHGYSTITQMRCKSNIQYDFRLRSDGREGKLIQNLEGNRLYLSETPLSAFQAHCLGKLGKENVYPTFNVYSDDNHSSTSGGLTSRTHTHTHAEAPSSILHKVGFLGRPPKKNKVPILDLTWISCILRGFWQQVKDEKLRIILYRFSTVAKKKTEKPTTDTTRPTYLYTTHTTKQIKSFCRHHFCYLPYDTAVLLTRNQILYY